MVSPATSLDVHPDIPYTSHNSCAVIHVVTNENADIDTIFATAQNVMLADFIEGSDPGLAVGLADQVLPADRIREGCEMDDPDTTEGPHAGK